MDVTIINPQLSYLDFRCKDTAKILFHQTLSRKKIEKSSFFLKMLCLLDFYYSRGGGSNRKWSHCRIVALSHRRIFLLHMRELYIWKGRMVLYLLYIIFIYYISIYINNRAHAGEVVRQCDNATMRRSFPHAEKAFPHTEIPFLRVRRPEFPPNRRGNFHPKKCRITPFFGLRRRPKKSPFLPKNDPTRYKTHPHP